MKQQKTKTTSTIKRRWWRKPWVWIVTSIVIVLVLAAVFFGVLLTAPNMKEGATVTMTPAQSRAEIYNLYVATREALGGTWSGTENSWFECTTTSGDQNGLAFTFAVDRRDQDVVGGPVTVANEVQSLWADRGYKAEISQDNTLSPPLYVLSDPPFLSGNGPDGFLIQLTLKGDVVKFTGTGRCVSGDIEKLNLAEPTIPDWTSTSTSSTP
jgi:hypothetical protein